MTRPSTASPPLAGGSAGGGVAGLRCLGPIMEIACILLYALCWEHCLQLRE